MNKLRVPITVKKDIEAAASSGGGGEQGPQGPTGPAGSDGADGQGVPTGGTTGQILKKSSGTDFDTEWADESGGGSSPDYATFYQATGGITGISNTAVTLNLASTQVNSDGAVFSLSANTVTVNKSTDFLVIMDNYINSGGSSRSEYSLWLERDSSEIAGTRHAVYARGYDSGQSASMSTVLSITSGDVFRMRIQRTDGGGTVGYQDNNGTRLTFIEMV